MILKAFAAASLALLAGLPLPAQPALAQAQSPSSGNQPAHLPGVWLGRWKSQVKTYQVSTDIVTMPRGTRQLEHDGTLEARFNFCADPDGTVHGAGTLKMTKNGSARIVKPWEEDNKGAMADELTCDQTFKPTAIDDMPMTVIGEMRGSDVWLLLNTGMIEFEYTNSCVARNLLFGDVHSYSGGSNLQFPAVGLLFIAAGTTDPGLANGVALPARDGEMHSIESSNVNTHSDKFDTLAEELTEVQIRRDPGAELPAQLQALCCPAINQADITESAGSIFIGARSGRPVGRVGPHDSCAESLVFTIGARVVYRRVVLNKETGKPEWYYLEHPGGGKGWVSAGDTSNTRPLSPPPQPPCCLPPYDPPPISASPTAGGRG